MYIHYQFWPITYPYLTNHEGKSPRIAQEICNCSVKSVIADSKNFLPLLRAPLRVITVR